MGRKTGIRCWWCHRTSSHFAFGLCFNCYRWFRKRVKEGQPTCKVCGNPTRNSLAKLCPACKSLAKAIPKRIIRLYDKVEPIKPILSRFDGAEEAYTYLSSNLKPAHCKWLAILLERYYKHKTMDNVAKSLGVSRQYINECEKKAIGILSRKFVALTSETSNMVAENVS
jgi:hypothetical protein